MGTLFVIIIMQTLGVLVLVVGIKMFLSCWDKTIGEAWNMFLLSLLLIVAACVTLSATFIPLVVKLVLDVS